MWSWLVSLWAAWMNPFDWAPDSDFPGDLECPDTQPTSPGALDSLEDAMRTAVLTIVILTLAGCAASAEIKGNTIVLTAEEMAACAKGCKLVTAAALEELRLVLEEAIKAAEQASSVCKKYSI